MENFNNIQNHPLINSLLFSIAWALNIIISKAAFKHGADPIIYEFHMTLFGFLFILLSLFPIVAKEITHIKTNYLIKLTVINILRVIGGILISIGIAYTFAVNAGFLVKFTLVTTTFLAWIFIKEKMTMGKFLAILLMIIGIMFVTTKGDLIRLQSGDILIIISCFFLSIAGIATRKILKNNSISGELTAFLRPVSALPIQLLIIFLSPLYPKVLYSIFHVNVLNFDFIGNKIASGICASLVWIFLNRSLKIASASYVTMISMFTPVLVTFLAVIFLKEDFVFIQLFGALLVIISGISAHKMKIDQQ